LRNITYAVVPSRLTPSFDVADHDVAKLRPERGRERKALCIGAISFYRQPSPKVVRQVELLGDPGEPSERLNLLLNAS